MWQVPSRPTCRRDKIDGVSVVFGDAGGNGEHIGIENNVFRRKTHLVDQQPVGAFANLLAALQAVGLPLFVEGHDYGGGPILAAQTRVLQESGRSEEHTSELQSLMRISYAVFCLKKKKTTKHNTTQQTNTHQ